MLEYEKKILLTREEFLALKRTLFRTALKTSQTNYYFDSDDLVMNKKGITCRIRVKEGKIETTIKQHTSDGERSDEKMLNTPIGESFKNFWDMGLHFQGSLTTNRHSTYGDRYCQMFLDENIYLEKSDYELEIEYIDGFEHNAVCLLNDIAEILFKEGLIAETEEVLSRVGKGKSKSARFFEWKRTKLE